MSYDPERVGQPYPLNAYGQPFSPPPQYSVPNSQPRAAEPEYAQPAQYAPYAGQAQYVAQGVQYGQPQYAQPAQYAPPVGYGQHDQYLPANPQGGFHNVVAHDAGMDHHEAPMADGQKLNYDPVQNPRGNACRDIGFLIAFVAHLIGMIILAGVHGPDLVDSMHSDSPPPATRPEDDVQEPSNGLMIGLLVTAAAIGSACSILWLQVMKRYSSSIIKVSMVCSLAISVLGVIAAFASSNPVLGVFFLLSLGLQALYYYYIRDRIPFATAILHSSVSAVQQNTGPIWLTYFMTLVEVGWLALWAFIFAAVWQAGNRVESVVMPDGTIVQQRVNNSSGLQFLQFYCVFSLYWTCQVLRNIQHTTTAGVVASWWFVPSVGRPTMPALKRAVTTSLGSICFASLVVAIIQSVRFLLRQARRDACRDIVDCLLQMVERAVKWFNQYSLCTVAIYGSSFTEAAKQTGQLMKAELFTMLINDDLSSMVLFMGAFVSGTIAGIIGAIWAYSADGQGILVMGILAFIIGFLVALLAMSVIQSAVTTTFVCWAADPATLAHNRPDAFGRIVEAAQPKYAGHGLQQYSANMQHPNAQHI